MARATGSGSTLVLHGCPPGSGAGDFVEISVNFPRGSRWRWSIRPWRYLSRFAGLRVLPFARRAFDKDVRFDPDFPSLDKVA